MFVNDQLYASWNKHLAACHDKQSLAFFSEPEPKLDDAQLHRCLSWQTWLNVLEYWHEKFGNSMFKPFIQSKALAIQLVFHFSLKFLATNTATCRNLLIILA